MAMSLSDTVDDRITEEVASDMNLLMDIVHREVLVLMQDAIQRTASFCATQCVKHVLNVHCELRKRSKETMPEKAKPQVVRPDLRCAAPKKACPLGSTFRVVTPRCPDDSVRCARVERSLSSSWQAPVYTPRSVRTPTNSFLQDSRSGSMTPQKNGTTSEGPTQDDDDDAPVDQADHVIDVHDVARRLEEEEHQTPKAVDALVEAIEDSPGVGDVPSRSSKEGVGESCADSCQEGFAAVGGTALPSHDVTEDSANTMECDNHATHDATDAASGASECSMVVEAESRCHEMPPPRSAMPGQAVSEASIAAGHTEEVRHIEGVTTIVQVLPLVTPSQRL